MKLRPDWICEVLSPSTEEFDRKRKLPRYALVGVDHLWLLDPLAWRLEVLAREYANWRLVEENRGRASVSAPPFEPAPFDLAPLWGKMAPDDRGPPPDRPPLGD